MKNFLVFILFVGFLPQAHAKINDFTEVDPTFYRGGIKSPTQSDFDFLKQNGIQTILNIRWFRFDQQAKEKKIAMDTDFNYVHVGFDSVRNHFFDPKEKRINDILADIVDPNIPKPLFLHCYTGMDRTGMIVALYRVLYQGWDVETAYQKEMVDYHYRTYLVRLKDYLFKHSQNPQQEREDIAKILAQRQVSLETAPLEVGFSPGLLGADPTTDDEHADEGLNLPILPEDGD